MGCDRGSTHRRRQQQGGILPQRGSTESERDLVEPLLPHTGPLQPSEIGLEKIQNRQSKIPTSGRQLNRMGTHVSPVPAVRKICPHSVG